MGKKHLLSLKSVEGVAIVADKTALTAMRSSHSVAAVLRAS